MSAENFLSRLDGVRRTGEGRWVARCPSHEDKGPSLAIRELEDGRILAHCFAGCAVDDVVGAIGLKLCDLFPARDPGHHRPERRLFPANDVLAAIGNEVLVVAIAGGDLLAGRPWSPGDQERLSRAVSRIWAALRAGGIYA